MNLRGRVYTRGKPLINEKSEICNERSSCTAEYGEEERCEYYEECITAHEKYYGEKLRL